MSMPPTRNGRHAGRRPSKKIVLCCGLALLLGLASEVRRWLAAMPETTVPIQRTWLTPDAIHIDEISASALDMPPDAPSAHASALAVLPGDAMLAFWWAGSRESGADVRVFAARWSGGAWGPPRAVVDRQWLGERLGFAVRRIGNPAAWFAQDGKVNLYVVATGLGGWAASRVVHLVSTDQGESFDVRRVLPLSPLFNTSVLVRTSPVGLPDGGWLLPLYFELGNKYPMAMSFDPRGQPRRLVRIGESTDALQPAIAMVSDQEVRAWMRDISDQRQVRQAVSLDGGDTWEDLPAMAIPNLDSSVAVLRLTDGGFVMLHNDRVTEDGFGRSVLRLSHSVDAKRWVHDFDVVAGAPLDEFSYPSVQQIGDELHVTYTEKRRRIAHKVYRISYTGPQP